MADRVVNGNTNTENGWRLVDTGSCVWVKVPGTNPVVSLQIREGQPEKIMGAFAADFNAYVEHLRDRDSACYTESNSVLGQPGRNNGSNHMSATAMDLDWELHPFRVKDAGFNPAQIATIREMLTWYEKTIFWGNDWDNPKDAMHFQMGYNTYGAENVARVQDFIVRKIRADGFSTFRRGGSVPPPPPAELSRTDRYALAIIAAGRKRNVSRKGICIALTVPPVETTWRNLANTGDPETQALPNDGTGSDHDSAGLFQQRRAWGPASCRMDPSCAAGLFFDGGQAGQDGLLDYPFDTDAKSPGMWAADVQEPAAQYRYRYDEHWQAANDLYDRLAGIQPSGDDMSAEDVARLERKIDRILLEQTQKHPSRSAVREPGEGLVDTWAGMDLNMDGNIDLMATFLRSWLRHDGALGRLKRVAAGTEPGRSPDDAKLATAMLAELPKLWTLLDGTARPVARHQPEASMGDELASAVAENARLRDELSRLQVENIRLQAVTQAPVETPALPALAETNGHAEPTLAETAKVMIEAIEQMQLEKPLSPEDRATLAGFIGVLKSKNGAQI